MVDSILFFKLNLFWNLINIFVNVSRSLMLSPWMLRFVCSEWVLLFFKTRHFIFCFKLLWWWRNCLMEELISLHKFVSHWIFLRMVQNIRSGCICLEFTYCPSPLLFCFSTRFFTTLLVQVLAFIFKALKILLDILFKQQSCMLKVVMMMEIVSK